METVYIKTITNLKKLPPDKLSEVNDFIEFILSRIDDQIISSGIQSLESDSFAFLENEPDLYTADDLKIKYK